MEMLVELFEVMFILMLICELLLFIVCILRVLDEVLVSGIMVFGFVLFIIFICLLFMLNVVGVLIMLLVKVLLVVNICILLVNVLLLVNSLLLFIRLLILDCVVVLLLLKNLLKRDERVCEVVVCVVICVMLVRMFLVKLENDNLLVVVKLVIEFFMLLNVLVNRFLVWFVMF